MHTKILIPIVVCLIGLYTLYILIVPPTQKEGDATRPLEAVEIPLAPEVEEILAKETAYLEELARDAFIISEVIASNTKDATLSKEEISRLDDEWQKSREVTPFIQQFLSNKTAGALMTFQTTHAGFKEIFVANAYGLNVGQTDKTSDYYQADESWWRESYNNGIGKTLHGKIEFDESSQSEAISLYVPIIDPLSMRSIGVLKGVLDLSDIKEQL